jgi:hypothetical protein
MSASALLSKRRALTTRRFPLSAIDLMAQSVFSRSCLDRAQAR